MGLIGNVVLPGTVSSFAGSSAPSGYLICDGTVQLRASYPALFAAIGTTWNTGGELGTQFRLPNGAGRSFIGAGTYTDSVSGSVTRTVATYLGAEKHVIATAEMPSHFHVTNQGTQSGGDGGAGSAGMLSVINVANVVVNQVGSATTKLATDSKGSGTSHNNMQPSFVGNWIIKT
jgi:microcystin-dependent protein